MLELRPTCEHCNPASTKVRHRPVDPAAHALFADAIKSIAPEKR